jgi:hypothetical protein
MPKTFEGLQKKEKAKKEREMEKERKTVLRRNINTANYRRAAKNESLETVSSNSSNGSSSSKSSNPDRIELQDEGTTYNRIHSKTRKGGKRKNRRTKRRSYRSKQN